MSHSKKSTDFFYFFWKKHFIYNFNYYKKQLEYLTSVVMDARGKGKPLRTVP